MNVLQNSHYFSRTLFFKLPIKPERKVLNAHQKRKLLVLRDYVLGWTIAFVFLSIVRGVGTEELGSLQFSFQASIIISLTLGPLMGLLSGGVQLWFEGSIYGRISIIQFLLLRLASTIFFVFALVLLAYAVYQLYFGTDLGLLAFSFDKGSLAMCFYTASVDFFLNVLRQINLMLGQGNLRKLFSGKFYQPREEDRIFMFLDLQSSTQLAEQLGHIRYSALIRDCFNDLAVVEEDGAEIYQYVGDEAVLTWQMAEGLNHQAFIQAYFRFRDRLISRGAYYESNYGVKPFFKAGVHGGRVTVTEIGKYKKEIAYHGDPINTAARIQGKCNELGAELLVSASMAGHLAASSFLSEKVGEIALRGKKEEMEIYAVQLNQ